MMINKFKKKKKFKIVALLAIRNEQLYIKRCLEHLIDQGIEIYVVDNGSTDNTVEIASSFLNKGVIKVEHLPYHGSFDLYAILNHKERLARKINAEWFIHCDADEIREAPLPYKTLKEAIIDIDRQGYNAVNFDEFVFLPVNEQDSFENKNYIREMKYYYYFYPKPLRRVCTWKKNKHNINLANFGGHTLMFEGQKIYPNSFILRHYIALSKLYLIKKYCNRKFFPDTLKRGWSIKRAALKADNIVLPAKKVMKEYKGNQQWDRSNPYKQHLFMNIK